ncbi:MAG: LytTR family transcriptional regulator DNA-binding domain-containing protein [Lachnospiraceae bacterium]|nr:LytTR family transcriptional regulator DNA-binding domain-containing protein [Lachnospiraceae bacterium]
MNITINVIPSLDETEIVVNCASITPETESIIASLRAMDSKITVKKGEESLVLDISRIAYIESVDRKTFVYTEDDFYETRLRLYEIEEQLYGRGFQRVSKSCLVHLRYIRSIRADIDRKLRLTLENGEQMIVSRQYANELKIRLGVK